MSTKPGIQSRKPRETKALSSSRVTRWILIMLFAGLPITTGLLVARWFGWGIDGALFGVMTGGIVGGVVLTAVVLRLNR